MTSPVLHLIAGPNGAGKSTLYRYLIQPRAALLPFINADVHEREALQHVTDPLARSEAARAWADAQRADCLQRGISFVSETVFSHVSKLDLLHSARARGFQTVLYVVCSDDPQQLLARVKQRVREGGHDVPDHKVLARYPRTLAHLAQAVTLADLALLFDAVDTGQGGPVLVASISAAGMQLHVQPVPTWARAVLRMA